jgi:pimeloyl-ACP methyl ester carboxylesterase
MEMKIKQSMEFKRTLIVLFLGLIVTPCISAQQAQLRPRVIVFVHGIHGDRNSFRAANGAYWPELVLTDPHFAYSDVEVAEYPTPDKNGKSSSAELAEFLFTRLKKDHVWEHSEVVFLAHSLGGILVEEMLLKHPAEAAKVRFIVSYGTPHQGSVVARIASLYDKDPLLNDLSDTSDNTFLTTLENNWRATTAVNSIHRFCAYETEDTRPDSGIARALKTHARVVSYFSATYGCDVTTPPQEIHTDHVNLVRPADRNSAAYDFFLRVYRANPILQSEAVTREAITAPLTATCDQVNRNTDLLVPIALDASANERLLSATASYVNASDLRDIYPNPPTVTHVDPNGVAHIQYGFTGPGKKLFVCLGSAHASLKVEFTILRQLPLREPGN